MSKFTDARAAGVGAITTTSDGAAATLAFPWRQQGVLSVCVEVTLAHALDPAGQLTPSPPEAADAGGGLVPYRDLVDVLVTGRVMPKGSARLTLSRGRATLVDKAVAKAAGLDGAGLGALSAADPSRAAWLRGKPPPAVSKGAFEIGPEVDRRFFQDAPPDQRVADLRPGDRFELQLLHGQTERVGFTVPADAPLAVATLGQATHTVAMRCDRLLVDLDRSRVVVTWRGSFTVPGEQSLPALRVHVTAPGAARPSAAGPPPPSAAAPPPPSSAAAPAPSSGAAAAPAPSSGAAAAPAPSSGAAAAPSSAAPNATIALVDGALPAASDQEPGWLKNAGANLPAALRRKLQKARPVAPVIGHKPAPAPVQGPGSGTAFVAPGGAGTALPFGGGSAPVGGGSAPFAGTMAIEDDQPVAAPTPFANQPSAPPRAAGATPAAATPAAALPGAPWSRARAASVPIASPSLEVTVSLGESADPAVARARAALAALAAKAPAPDDEPSSGDEPAAPPAPPTNPSAPAESAPAESAPAEPVRAAEPPPPAPPSRPAEPPADPWGGASAPAVAAPLEVKPPPRQRPDVKSALRKKFGR